MTAIFFFLSTWFSEINKLVIEKGIKSKTGDSVLLNALLAFSVYLLSGLSFLVLILSKRGSPTVFPGWDSIFFNHEMLICFFYVVFLIFATCLIQYFLLSSYQNTATKICIYQCRKLGQYDQNQEQHTLHCTHWSNA